MALFSTLMASLIMNISVIQLYPTPQQGQCWDQFIKVTGEVTGQILME